MGDQTPVDRRSLRGALGMFATGVTVITTRRADGTYAGFTANSFSSVSLEPPLVLWSLGLDSPNLPTFEASSHYAINVLAADQAHLSQRFAASGTDKFAGLALLPGAGGAPLLPGCCAWFECANETRYPGGDHLIFIGRVLAYAREERAPLIFHEGRYRQATD
ncbi:MAG: flavin reductase family protein [Rhodocyclaceae bacterium]|nr:flavin reductase family protein [Rhodocyclaceae bacterium]